MKNSKAVDSPQTERYIVNTRGKKTAVVIDIAEYDQMVEDLHDLAVVAERRDEPTISSVSMKRRLGVA
jgi:prevent-host-death family protein